MLEIVIQSAGDRVSKYSKKQKTNKGNLGLKIESQKNLKVKDLLMIPNRVAIVYKMQVGISGQKLFGINQTQCQKV